MVYIGYDKLSLVKVNEKEDVISFAFLAKAILDKPANIIYCESDEKLCGIISMGDIVRAWERGDDDVIINRQFTQISQKDKLRMAKRIFHEKKSINALPVTSEDNKLLGAYVRWDDLCNRNMFCMGDISPLYKNYRYIVFVRPCKAYSERYRLFKSFYGYMLSNHSDIKVETITYSEVADYGDRADLILFTSEDEARAINTYIRCILRKDFPNDKVKTYKDWAHEVKRKTRYEFVRQFLCDINSQGVHILNLYFNESDYFYGKLYDKIQKKFSDLGEEVSYILPFALWPGFFDELYTEEYAAKIMQLPFSVETGNFLGRLKDCSEEFCNVTNGERRTVGQPMQYQRTVYFIGPCFIYGHYVEDKNTIESFLQRRINDMQEGVKIVNCGSLISRREVYLRVGQIQELSLRKGDCIVLYIGNHRFQDIPEIDLMEIVEKNDVNEYWIVDNPIHCNHRINALYAEAIYNKLIPVLKEPICEREEEIEIERNYIKTGYIDRYFTNFNPYAHGKIGSIVMNCNPFTLGHQHLIEKALQIVDFLILFVVEEDKSIFSFDERFAMVYEATKDLDNVMAVPSGPFILSQTTFPEYFIKEADEDIVRNAENDIMLFAEKIAPGLNISYRFVGEEPEDPVTNEYNSAMKKILPKKGIRLIEVPRKKIEGKYISASLVRKCLGDFNLEKLHGLVPEATLKILFSEE